MLERATCSTPAPTDSVPLAMPEIADAEFMMPPIAAPKKPPSMKATMLVPRHERFLGASIADDATAGVLASVLVSITSLAGPTDSIEQSPREDSFISCSIVVHVLSWCMCICVSSACTSACAVHGHGQACQCHGSNGFAKRPWCRPTHANDPSSRHIVTCMQYAHHRHVSMSSPRPAPLAYMCRHTMCVQTKYHVMHYLYSRAVR